MIKTRFLSFLIFCMVFFASCDVLQQVEGIKSFAKCEFRINTVTDIHLANVNLSNIQKVSDIKTMDMLQLTNALFSNQMPMRFNVNLQVKNPNSQPAALNRMEWLLFIDEKQLLDGIVNERFMTGPGETGTLPLQIGLNLSEILQGEQINKVIDYALGLADGSGQTTRVMLKLKPSVMVGQQNIIYPGWIEVRHEFTAQ